MVQFVHTTFSIDDNLQQIWHLYILLVIYVSVMSASFSQVSFIYTRGFFPIGFILLPLGRYSDSQPIVKMKQAHLPSFIFFPICFLEKVMIGKTATSIPM